MPWELLAAAPVEGQGGGLGGASATLAVVAFWVVASAGVWAFAKSKGRRAIFRNYMTYCALIFFGVLMALPFYWMVITSLKTPGEASAFPPTWWPSEFRWSNYAEAWRLGQSDPIVSFARYFYVSVMTSAVSTLGALFTAVMAAYAFAKMRFFGSGLFFYIMLAMMMVPGQVLLVPSYVILHQIGWLNTFYALIVPWLASMFAIFLLRQFIMSIPDDLWDAAQIDGAGRFRFLWTVVVPLSVPALITTGIFLFLGNWNSLIWPLVVTSKPEMRTIQVGLQAFDSGAGTDYHLLMAASTLVIAPVIIAFFFAQRYFIEGIARSGIK